MKFTRLGFTMAATALAVAASAQSVPHATVHRNAGGSQLPITWVSGTGNDSNPCTRTAPCATFATAYATTLAGGEVVALDAGDYGPLTIDRSVTISGAGAQITAASLPGGSSSSSQSAITVAAGPNDSVTLRNLDLNGLGQSANFSTGIKISSAKTVHIENVRITNFDGSGILVQSTGNIVVTVTDSVSSDNEYGIAAIALNGTANVLVAKSHFAQENIGIFGAFGVNIMVSDSDVVRGQVGFEAANSTVDLVRSKAVDESTAGVQADSGGTIHLSDTTVANDAYAVKVANGGVTYSFGNNAFINASVLTGTLPLQ